MQLYFGDSLSRVTPIASLLKSSRNSLASQAPNREKDLEKFQFSRFLSFSRLTLATGSRVEAPVASLLRMLPTPFTTYSRVDLPIAKNT